MNQLTELGAWIVGVSALGVLALDHALAHAPGAAQYVQAAAQADAEAYRRTLGGDAFVIPGERRSLDHGAEQ